MDITVTRINASGAQNVGRLPVIETEAPDTELEDIYEEAYIAACELVGPNSPEFDECFDKQCEEILARQTKELI